MKIPFNTRSPSFDATAITETIQRALASAGLDTNAGPMAGVTETIRKALSSGRPADAAGPRSRDNSIIDVAARDVGEPGDDADARGSQRPKRESAVPGGFETFTHSGEFGSRAYRLYVPANVVAQPAMIVMLHGCTQSASDFAAGTQMNRLAEEHRFLVLYPEQSASANMSKCWNWFSAQDQVRDSGEPGLLAGLVREVALRHQVDLRRIFVAGLSAGAAMAVVLGQTYPDLFAGVGAHSGLPFASAHDIPSAMAAMKGGRGLSGMNMPSSDSASRKSVHAVPTIVFHGDRDHTVQHSNGQRIFDEAGAAFKAERGETSVRPSTTSAASPGGRRYHRTVNSDATGVPLVEAWTVHGAGHAWSGGHASGTYTDGSGPDASAEMVRFFLALPRPGSA